MNTEEKLAVAGLINVGSLSLKKASDENNDFRAAKKRADDLRPSVLDYAVQSNMIRNDDREVADAMFGSHAETLGLFKQACEVIVQQQAKIAALEKQAGVAKAIAQQGSAASPFGANGSKSASDSRPSQGGFEIVGARGRARMPSDDAFASSN